MRHEKCFLISLALVMSACGGGKSTPTENGGSDAQAGAGGGGGGKLDALAAVDVLTAPRSDGASDTPSVSSGCSSSLECSGRADNLKVCSVPTRECVECLTSNDCSPGTDALLPGRECVKNACLTRPACTNSLDCPVGNVCDRGNGVCVQCTANTDCTAEQICAGGTCRKRCASDIECTPLRLLCETKLGYCASCVLDTDCPASQFCSQGECLRDICSPGTTKCQNNTVVTCNAAGSGWVSPVACKTNQSCRDTGSAGICADRVCTPSAKTCSTEGEKVVSCSADGLTSTVLEDCAASGKVCANGVCATGVCTAGAKFCQGVEVRQCSVKGESSSLVSTCTSSQYCDGATTTCKTKLCTANQPTCSGTVATTCDAVGAAPLPGGTDCAAQGLICYQGKCQTYACTASSVYCDNGTVRQCSSDGFSSTLVTTCTASQYCDKGACKAQFCQPNQPICNGKVATTCNADGSGYSPDGIDCSLTNQGCAVGLCKDQVCTPSTYFCGENNTVMYCNSTGLSASTYQTCSSSQYCDNGACKTQVCSPGLPTCNLKVATTCNAKGSGYEAGGTDCALTNQVCASGECKTQVCTPSTYFCQQSLNELHYCASTGLSSTVSKTCTSTQYCDAVNRACYTRVCTPGAAVCDGNLLTVCKDDGSGPATGGTACATGKSCDAGVCKDQVCTPSAYVCQDNTVRLCDSKGLTTSLSTTCSTGLYCDPTSKTCKARLCTPSQPACNNKVATTCNADGWGYAAGGTDCSTESKICSSGTCVTGAVDTIDLDPANNESKSTTTSALKVNFYSVTTPRTLLQIEQYLNAPAGATLTWAVYSSASKTGTYTRLSPVTTSVAVGGAGYASSGPISVALQAETYYAIGVSWTTSTTYWYHTDTAAFPIAVTFGSLESGRSGTAGATSVDYASSSTLYYPQRLTTGP